VLVGERHLKLMKARKKYMQNIKDMNSRSRSSNQVEGSLIQVNKLTLQSESKGFSIERETSIDRSENT